MSKKFKSQASSARAASTAFGNASGFGFGSASPFQTSTSLLSYITEQTDLSRISEANLVVAFKNLSKKDSVTKEKALDELHNYLSEGSKSNGFVVEDGVIDAWINLYPRTSIDNSRRVRQLAHTSQGILTTLCGKRIVPHLPKIIGPWFAGTFDQDKSVSRAASDALQESFNTPEKRKSLWKLYRKDLVEFVEDAATVQTAKTLSDERNTNPDDAEAKYVRVVGTALSVLNTLLLEHSDQPGKGDDLLETLLQSPKLWEHAYYSDPFIRRAAYTLFTTCLEKKPNLLNWKVISSAFLGKGLHANQLGSTGPFSQALLSITRHHPQSWTTEYTSKVAASKRLLKFLQQGSQRGPAAFWTNMAELLQMLPQEVWFQGKDVAEMDAPTAKQILEAYHSGIVSPDEPRQNLTVAWKSYVEVSLWLCGLIKAEDSRNTVLTECVLPIIKHFVSQDPETSTWSIATPSAASICVQILVDFTSKLGSSMLQTFWQALSEMILTAVKISQPESSSSFRSSQDNVAICSRRMFGLAAGVLSTASPDLGAEDVLGKSALELIEQCTDILHNRAGKPYGAASLTKNAIEALNPVRSPKYSTLLRTAVLDFLEENFQDISSSPSAEILISLLLDLRQDTTYSSKAQKILEQLLSREDLDTTDPAIQSIVSKLTEEDLNRYPKIAQGLVNQVNHAIGQGDDKSWVSLNKLLVGLPTNSKLKEDIISKMLSGLSLESNPRSVMQGFESMFTTDSKASVEKLIGPANTSELLSKLLVIEETHDEEISNTARKLSSQVRESLKRSGSASKLSVNIIKQQLSKTGEEALSIHTVVDLARDIFASKSVADEGLQDIFPDDDEWKAATDPFLQSSPSYSFAVMSILQGAALMVEETGSKPKVSHDADGYSAAVRLALFTISLTKSNNILERISTSRRSAFLLYVPLVLQIVNEKLDIGNTNDAWTSETQVVEDEMVQLVSDGRKVLSDLIQKQITSEALSTAPDSSTIEGCWLEQLSKVSGNTPQAYRLAVASAEVLSLCIDAAGASRYSKIWADSLAVIRKSANIFQSAALVVVTKTGLLPTKRLCTELIVDITSMKHTDSDSGLNHAVILNLLLEGEDELLAGLPMQRLVFFVKSVVKAIENETFGEKALGEYLKLLNHVLPAVESIYDDFWTTLWDSVAQIIQRQWITPVSIPLLHSTLKLSSTYNHLAASEANDDLVELWEERGGPSNLAQLLMYPLKQYSVYHHANAGLESDPTSGKLQLLFGKHKPRSIVMGLLGRLLGRLPVDKIDQIDELFALLESDEREVQSAAFDVLHRHITDAQEQVSLDAALSKQPVHLPKDLMSLLEEPPSMDSITESVQIYDVTWAGPRSYLLAWKLVFDHFTKASHKLREMYAEDIKASDQLNSLLPFINDLLKITTVKPVDTSKFAVDSFDFKSMKTEPQAAESQILAAHLYYLCLLYLPNLTRTWWVESKNKIKGPLETWTQKNITPKLCNAAMAEVEEWIKTIDADDDHPLEVKVAKSGNELTANIPVDPEADPVSLMITLPAAYPLQQAIVTSRNRVAVSEKNWQSWLRTIKGIIMFSNGSIIDGLLAFRRNVQGALKGQSECAICYSIIGTDMKTPDKKCGTCKNTFHGACLFRWFSSSNSSTCPLCRNSFNYA